VYFDPTQNDIGRNNFSLAKHWKLHRNIRLIDFPTHRRIQRQEIKDHDHLLCALTDVMNLTLLL
jgi:hypothetical protein